MKCFILSLVILPFISVYSQIIFVSPDNNVYDFLSSLSIKGIISFNDEIKPLSRDYISGKIYELESKKNYLTGIEVEELDFYAKEYFLELKKFSKVKLETVTSFFNFNDEKRFRVFTYYDSLFSISADPVFGYDLKSFSIKNHSWNGVNLLGSIGSNVGFNLNFRDNHVSNINDGLLNKFSNTTGIAFFTSNDYDEVNGNLAYSWNWGDFSLGKDYFVWGSGKSGQIILSENAPSFPFIKLNVYPVSWLDFTYFHGLLISGVIDSNSIRINKNPTRIHSDLVEKYMVAHILTVRPYSNLNISLGESVIYSDRFQPIYLIPMLFFRLVDHYQNFTDANGGNAQLFSNISYKNSYLNTKFYTTLFIDELTLTKYLKGIDAPKAVAYTVGTIIIDPGIKDVSFNLEYTKLDPDVYFHEDDAQLYTNYRYQMGHWIGSNGDQVHFSVTKKILRGLNLLVSYDYIRKGHTPQLGELLYQPGQNFLFGLRTNYRLINTLISYELINDFFIKVGFNWEKIDKELTSGNFNTINDNYLTFSINYGF
ncbi:MAG: capsule assembly Wzi family protein [Ignavibacteriaceae bacterium]|nr:capsule assembly Wzi family protein [Ignavibacteriaceae bacterium]